MTLAWKIVKISSSVFQPCIPSAKPVISNQWAQHPMKVSESWSIHSNCGHAYIIQGPRIFVLTLHSFWSLKNLFIYYLPLTLALLILWQVTQCTLIQKQQTKHPSTWNIPISLFFLLLRQSGFYLHQISQV